VSAEDLHKDVVRGTATISFYVLLAAEIAWICSLPVFPSQDGSMHLYFARIISRLLSGPTLYSKYFYIQHILPPYSLHYYFLAAAMKVLSPRVAEKVLVCGASILLAFGFRFFTRTIGDRTGVVSLAVLPLLLHQPLLMGFYNYSMAIGVGFWASAFWVRASRNRQLRDWLIFLALTYIALLTHPVPLALVLTFAGIDLVSRVLKDALRSRRFPEAESTDWKQYRVDVLFLFLAAVSSLYVAAFMTGTQAGASLLPSRTIREAILLIAKVECAVGVFAGPGIATLLYRVGLCALVGVSVWLGSQGFAERLRRKQWRTRDLLLVAGVLMILLYPWIPSTINAADHFADRLMVVAWLVCAASAAGAKMTPWSERIAIALPVSLVLFILCLAQIRIAPAARYVAELENVPDKKNDGVGLFLCSSRSANGLAFVPYWWAGVSYFRDSDAILLSTPWLESHYMMLAGKPPLMTKFYPTRLLDDPLLLSKKIAASPAMEREYVGLSNLILVTRDPSLKQSSPGGDIQAQLTAITGKNWSMESGSWFTLYRALN